MQYSGGRIGNRGHVQVVVLPPTSDRFVVSACNTPFALPMCCHRRSVAPPFQVRSFRRDRMVVREVAELRLRQDPVP